MTVAALYRNLLDGTQPADVNGQILGRQALYFLEKGEVALAIAALNQAFHLNIGVALRERLADLRESLSPAPTARLIDKWRLTRRWGFWLQLTPALLVVGFVAWVSRDNLIVLVSQETLAHVGDERSVVLAEPRPVGPVLEAIRPFENFHVLAGWGTGGYERILTDRGALGFLPAASIIPGDGAADLKSRCFPSGPVTLANGFLFRQAMTGAHRLRTTNGLAFDAVVKLRNTAGRTVLSFYVTSGSVVTVDTVPDGLFTIEFATGREFSPTCGYFLTDMKSQRFVNSQAFDTTFQGAYEYTSTLEITLNPVPDGAARTVDTDDMSFGYD
jgi:hypothetical protein